MFLKIKDWFAKAFDEAITRALALVLTGIIISLASLVFAAQSYTFLLQELRAPTILIIILALFALIGLASVVSNLAGAFAQIKQSKSTAPINTQQLDAAAQQLLQQLTRVEAGVHFANDYQKRGFTSSLLSLFDVWESAVLPFLTEEDSQEVRTLRSEIAQQSLEHTNGKAKSWVKTVKDMTYKVKRNPE